MTYLTSSQSLYQWCTKKICVPKTLSSEYDEEERIMPSNCLLPGLFVSPNKTLLTCNRHLRYSIQVSSSCPSIPHTFHDTLRVRPCPGTRLLFVGLPTPWNPSHLIWLRVGKNAPDFTVVQ